jgi:hypothetical protein
MGQNTKTQQNWPMAQKNNSLFFFVKLIVTTESFNLQSLVVDGGAKKKISQSAEEARQAPNPYVLIATLLRRHLTDKVARTRHNTLPWRSNSCTTLLQPRHDYNRESQLPTRSPL